LHTLKKHGIYHIYRVFLKERKKMTQAKETRITQWGTGIMPEQRRHIPLAERMEIARKDGTWDQNPPETTQEDNEWLNMPSAGEELAW
jgi:hypothetical protein